MQQSSALKTPFLEKMGDFITSEFFIQLAILCNLDDILWYMTETGISITSAIHVPSHPALQGSGMKPDAGVQYIGRWDFCEGARDPFGNRGKRRTKKMSGVRLGPVGPLGSKLGYPTLTPRGVDGILFSSLLSTKQNHLQFFSSIDLNMPWWC